MDSLTVDGGSWLFEAFSLPPHFRSFPAVRYEEMTLSYEELSYAIDKTARSLEKAGVIKGDRVAFLGTSTVSTILAFLALLKLGASPCLLSIRAPKEMLSLLMLRARVSFFLEQDTLALSRISSQEPREREILLFTSGSSGVPKLACFAFEHFLLSAKNSAVFLDLSEGKSSWLLSVPLFHVSGLSIVFRCLTTGSAINIATLSQPLALSVSHVSFVPTQLIRLLEGNLEGRFSNLDCLLLGGAPISEDLFQRGLCKNLPLKLTYGMTETASQITMTEVFDTTQPMHLGKVLPGKQILFSSEGEILVKGDSLFLGYDEGKGPVLPLVHGGWFATGDLGSLSEEGNLLYKGRKDNLFISGGENIYPEEIEKALGLIPGVTLALVIPEEDREYGMRPVAFLQMDAPLLTKEEFYERLSDKIPKFAFPVRFCPFPIELDLDFKIKRSDLKKWIVNRN